MEVFDDRVCRLGEGPHYDERTDRVLWVDVFGARVLWRGLESGESGESPTEGHVSAAVPRRNGGLVLCLPDGPALLEPDGTLRLLGTYGQADAVAGRTPSADAPAMRSNDAKADPAGRLWLGTMAYDETVGAGALYRLDPGATGPVRMVDGITVSNGPAFSPDGTTMYYTDTITRRIDAFAYDPVTGGLGERRVFIEVPPDWGFPDGMCVDAAGGVWAAFWEGAAVRRFLPDGSLDRVVEVPGATRVTSCAFAGPALDRLVVTTAGGGGANGGMTYLHRLDDVTGLPADRFAG